MTLIRVIEEFNKSDERLNNEYILHITPEKIVEILDDLVLNEDDCSSEIYDPYDLTYQQIEKLKPFLNTKPKQDLQKYSYQLSCYEE